MSDLLNETYTPIGDFEQKRLKMVVEQIERRGLRQPRLLEAMRRVPRHRFVSFTEQESAYYDGPLPIGCGQTISQPYIVALMTNLAALNGDETVLEVGTGSGYQAAVLACMARCVHTIERHAELAERARQMLRELDFNNVEVHSADGSFGWVEAQPYQAILVTAAAPQPPPPLLEQLAEGGRLVLPVGDRGYQELQVWTRQGEKFLPEDIIPVAFVPLRGKYGWQTDRWNP
jgi:protein-L-isoaspartate(D-aspartate) O-methyltransferase